MKIKTVATVTITIEIDESDLHRWKEANCKNEPRIENCLVGFLQDRASFDIEACPLYDSSAGHIANAYTLDKNTPDEEMPDVHFVFAQIEK
jgi:hypothetical protein